MGKVKRYKKTTWGVMSPLHATISTSWVPLTFALLLYTSGIDLSIGESAAPSEDEPTENGTTVKRNYNLTGNPQIDYIHDPNLPRELNGYNLSDYPFYSRVPSKINYSCEGLKDGFYSNIEHKCQVYHHCLYGARHDFLCANFTAFDQKTFICQFVSEVDCANSALFYHRNDALYPEKPTTPVPEPIKIRPGLYERRRPPPRNSDRHPAAAAAAAAAEGGGASQDPAPGVAPLEEEGVDPYYDSEEDYRPVRRKPLRRRCKNKRRCRRPSRRRPRPRPVYYDDYEDDYEDDYDSGYDDYYEDRPKQRGGRRKDKTGNKVAGSKVEESVVTRERGTTTTTTTASTTTTTTPSPEQVEQETFEVEQAKNREEILSKARPTRIRKYEFSPQGRSASPGERSTTTSTTPPPQSSSTSPSVQEVGDDYYYDNDDGQQQAAPPTAQPRTTSKPKPTVPTTQSLRQRFISRNFRQSPATTKGPITTTTTATTSTPSTTTTPKPTTAASTTTNTTPRPQRVTLRSQPTTASTATTTTSTTTEAPQYEYEYEYEDDIPSSSQVPLAPTTQITTTTTPTTTVKPVRPLIRGNKRPQLGGTVQTSTSVSVQEQDGNDEVDDSQNAINRRQSSWVRGQQSRTSPSSSSTPASSPTPASTSVTSSTSERVSYQPQGRGNRQQQQPSNNHQEPSRENAPVITVKSQSPISPPPSQIPQYQLQNSGAKETPAIKNRPSRFWQRPTKVVASSSTTAGPPASLFSEYDYSDADEEETPAPAVTRFTQPSSNSRFKSTPSLVPSSTSSYSDRETQSNSNSYRGQYTASSGNSNTAPQQYLRSTISQPNSYPTPSRSPPTPQNNFISQYGPSPSSIGIQYQHQLPSSTTSSSRPEFISLLRDDEDPYSPYETQQQDYPRSSSSSSSSSSSFTNSNNNNNRRIPAPARTQYFGGTGPSSSGGHFHNSQKHLYSAAQETYHSFLPAPSRFNFMNMGMSDFGGSGPGMVLYSRNPVMLSGKKK